MSEAGYSTSAVVPVYPIDWTQKRIVDDKDCFSLTSWSVRKVLTEDVHEKRKKEGYSARFKATFRIVRNGA